MNSCETWAPLKQSATPEAERLVSPRRGDQRLTDEAELVPSPAVWAVTLAAHRQDARRPVQMPAVSMGPAQKAAVELRPAVKPAGSAWILSAAQLASARGPSESESAPLAVVSMSPRPPVRQQQRASRTASARQSAPVQPRQESEASGWPVADACRSRQEREPALASPRPAAYRTLHRSTSPRQS